ncbi:MAG TPA: formyltransferase family protein, partial [Novosphingobium sp.]|nr:formyltransferase family protein [Novosphingobium sp.]
MRAGEGARAWALSLQPRPASRTSRAIEAGDSHGGVTVHLVTPELDDGPILG